MKLVTIDDWTCMHACSSSARSADEASSPTARIAVDVNRMVFSLGYWGTAPLGSGVKPSG